MIVCVVYAWFEWSECVWYVCVVSMSVMSACDVCVYEVIVWKSVQHMSVQICKSVCDCMTCVCWELCVDMHV